MGTVVTLNFQRAARVPVRVSTYPLGPNIADVEIMTPDGTTVVTVSRYEAASLMQRLERSTDPAAELAGFVEAHGEDE